MRAQVFQDAVSSSTRVFGRSDVNVVFRGDGACTDGKTVYLPALPSSAEINIDQAAVIRGYRDHEAMHVRVTDTSKAGLALIAEARSVDPLLESLVQYCEDVRIEHAGVLEYPGMAVNLTAVNTEASRVLLEQAEKLGDTKMVFSQCGRDMMLKICVSNMGRKLIGVENGGVMDRVVEIIKAADPEIHAFAEQCAKRMAELPTGYRNGKLVESTAKKGTHDAAKLAREIYNEFMAKYQQKPQPQEQQPPQQPQGQQQGDDDQSDPRQTNGSSASDVNADDGQPADNQGDDGGQSDADDGGDDGHPGDSDSDGSSGSGDGDGTDTDQPGDGFDAQPDDTRDASDTGDIGSGGGAAQQGIDASSLDVGNYSKAVDRVVDEIGQTSKDGRTLSRSFHKPWSNQYNSKLPIEEYIRTKYSSSYSRKDIERSYEAKLKHALVEYQDMASKISGKRAMIRRLLELELQARDDRRWEAGHSTGRLHSVRLVDAINGKQNVYQNRHDGKDMNTALVIAIDGSGSMNGGGRMESSLLLALALTEALERTGCEIEVSVWGNGSNYDYGVTDNTENDYLRPFGDMLSQCGGRHDYTSFGIIHRGVIKGMRQRLSDEMVQKRFALAKATMRSGTPFFDAVFNDLHDMAKLPHKKKIYMCITDGEADDVVMGSTVQKSDLIAEYQALANRNNIHLVGVGISGMTVGHLFKDSINVSGSDAYEPAIKLLSKIIAKEVGHGTFRRAA